MDGCLFCKIIKGEISSKKIYEDDLCYGFYDITPQAPVHFLVVPKMHIESVNEITEDNCHVAGHIYSIIPKLAKELGIFDDGYRVVVNCGSNGQQTVDHLHYHVLGGRMMTWPPG